MKVFVAGATGALGSKLVPRLVAGGHDVVGMTRSERKAGMIQQMGATPAIADGLDAEAVGRAVGEAEPEVIVHELTALSGSLDLRKFEQSFALTNRLRTEGTDHLLAAARAVGAKRFIAQSYAAWTYERTGGPIKTEDDPLDPDPVPATRTTLDAIRYLEAAVTGAEWVDGLVLRYGGFYGPGTSMSLNPDGEHVEMIRKRKFPLVGESSGIWSIDPDRRRGRRYRRCRRGWRARHLQRGRRPARRGRGLAAGPRRGGGRQAPYARPALACQDHGR